MNTIIRKISVGREYPDGSLHYQVGSKQILKRRKYVITHILMDRELLQLGKLGYNIYVKNIPEYEGEIVNEVLWKTVIDVTCVVENNIDFD